MNPAAKSLVRVFLSTLFGVFAIPTLGYGGYLLFCWFRIHTSHVYYVEYPYASIAFIFLSAGLLSLWAAWYGAWRRSFYGLLFVVPVFLGLAAMVEIPNIRPQGFGSIADTNYLSSVNSFFRVWYEQNRRFPANEAEFQEAMTKGPATWQYRVAVPTSEYRQADKVLPYEIAVVNDANGPRISEVSKRPGVVYYCVSTDLQEFWVTTTGLESDFAMAAVLHRVASIPAEEAFVVHAAGRDYPVKK
jgi:hypothetical protein